MPAAPLFATALRRPSVEWLSLPAADGSKMPGVLLKPFDFDSTRKYPLLFFVYGGRELHPILAPAFDALAARPANARVVNVRVRK